MFRRSDPRDEPADERAAAARNSATQAFLALDDEQRTVAEAVRAAGELLDAQSVRLANAQERLTGAHPDYWLYLTELRGIRDRVKDVVVRARSTSPRR